MNLQTDFKIKELRGNLLQEEDKKFVLSEVQKSQNHKEATVDHCLHAPPGHAPYLNDVYSKIREQFFLRFGCEYGCVENAILRASTHFGNNHEENLGNAQNS